MFLISELASHPDVLEVSVVAREHPKWGERPMAFVILHVESAKRWAGKHATFSSELKAHARERLPGFAVPEWVAVVEELPVRHFMSLHASLNDIAHQKTSTGKIQKTVLRKRAAAAKL
jgi:acyl-CoA synthetase (AMP-forming)/AMP-acid ligase II